MEVPGEDNVGGQARSLGLVVGGHEGLLASGMGQWVSFLGEESQVHRLFFIPKMHAEFTGHEQQSMGEDLNSSATPGMVGSSQYTCW